MTGGNVHQANAVRARINEAAEKDSRYNALHNHVDAITDELASRNSFDFVDGQWVLSHQTWTDWLCSGEHKKYLGSFPEKKTGGFKTPKWLDFLLLGGILVLAVWVSNLIATAQEDAAAGWGVFLTSLGLVLSLATRDWKILKTATYYFGLFLGIGGLITAIVNVG